MVFLNVISSVVTCYIYGDCINQIYVNSKVRYYPKVFPSIQNLKLKAQHMRGSSVFETLVTTNVYQMRKLFDSCDIKT